MAETGEGFDQGSNFRYGVLIQANPYHNWYNYTMNYHQVLAVLALAGIYTTLQVKF